MSPFDHPPGDTTWNQRHDLLPELAQGIGALSVDMADIAGALSLVQEGVAIAEGEAEQLRQVAGAVAQTAQSLAGGAAEAERGLAAVSTSAEEARSQAELSAARAAEAAERVRDAARQGSELEAALANVARITDVIAGIARQTNLLALNATIEAARAGDAGLGFSVVAREVKELAGATRDATDQIGTSISALSRAAEGLRQSSERGAAAAQAGAEAGSATSGALDRALDSVAAVKLTVEGMASLGVRTGEGARQMEQSIARQAEASLRATQDLTAAAKRGDALQSRSEALMQKAAAGDIEIEDTPFIRAVQGGAGRIASALEAALDQGLITMEALFDESYQPVAGSQPAQVTTRFTALTDTLFPPIQEPMLQLDERVVFCAAVDRNAYLPTHNRKFSQRQRPNDPAWNMAHCRNQRIFDDRTGLRAAQNTEAFLLQAYRRSMGGGEVALMKDCSAPIRVRGRHWGGLRLAYRVA